MIHQTLQQKLRQIIKEVPDFPKKGINFKDITPLLKEPYLCKEVIIAQVQQLECINISAIAGIESRGFLFGMLLAQEMNLPFIPIRKHGKLPSATLSQSYQLEYGEASIEIHQETLTSTDRVLLHDDLLATGGTIKASAELIKKTGAQVAAISVLIELEFLNARAALQTYTNNIFSLLKY